MLAGVNYFSSNSPSIQPGTLIALLIESVLDGLFFAAAAPGVSSPWVYTAPTLGTKQSGATFVVNGDHSGNSMEITIPRQIDALVNMGIVFTLPGLVYSAEATNTSYVYKIDGTVNGSAAGANPSALNTSTLDNDGVSTTLTALVSQVQGVAAHRLVPPGSAVAAYAQFAQYGIIKTVKVSLNSSHIVSMTGEELLVLHDVYGCGIHGLDVLSNAYFNTNDYHIRAAQSAVASTHVISLSLWWSQCARIDQGDAGQSFKNAFLPSSVAYSPLTVAVEFNTPASVTTQSADTTETTSTNPKGQSENTTANLQAKFVFDGYFMTSAEKEILQKTSSTQAYRKLASAKMSHTLAGSTQNLNFNFIGADIIAWGKETANPSLGKHGKGGKNDSELNYLEKITYSLNHNEMASADHATTAWNAITGNTHMPRLGCLYFTAAPGSDIQAVMQNKPVATIPFSRAENTSVKFETSAHRGSKNLDVTFLTNVYSALAKAQGTMNVLYN